MKEEIYIKQHLNFKSVTFLNHVLKINKTLYDLKQTYN